MTTDDRFGTSLSSWLREDAAHRVPDHLAETLVQTAATRQRPWWSSLERLLPMSSTTMGGRVAVPSPDPAASSRSACSSRRSSGSRSWPTSRRRRSRPLGSPRTARIVAVDGDVHRDVRAGRHRPPGGGPRPAVRRRADPGDVARRDPRRVPDQTARTASRSPGSTTATRTDDPGRGRHARSPTEYIGWSPDGTGSRSRALTERGRGARSIAAADGSSVRSLREASGPAPSRSGSRRYSPDGEWIAFAGNRLAATRAVRRSTRTAPGCASSTSAPSPDAGNGGGPVWSPGQGDAPAAYETFVGRRAPPPHVRPRHERGHARSAPGSGRRGRPTEPGSPAAAPPSGRSTTPSRARRRRRSCSRSSRATARTPRTGAGARSARRSSSRPTGNGSSPATSPARTCCSRKRTAPAR